MPAFFKQLGTLVGKFPFIQQHWATALIFIFGAALLCYNLGSLPLIVPDEGRNAEVAREMAVSGNWLVPTYNGIAYLDKPAFYFKTVALSFQAFGESEAVARLSSTFFGFSLLLALFFFCRKVYDLQTARLAFLVTATTPLFLVFCRIVIFDMTLAFFVSSSIFACFLAEESTSETLQKRWYFLGAICAGCATLVKGPVGFIVPSLVISLYNYTAGNGGFFKRCYAGRNWSVFLAIVLPWFIGLSLERPDFPYYGIMKESVSRFTTQEFKRTQPFYFYALIIAGTFFAWSLLLPESIREAWKKRQQWHRADRLLIIWSLVVVVFFSISQSKLPGYILSITVALGALTARVFVKSLSNSDSSANRIIRNAAIGLSALSLLGTVLLGYVITHEDLLLSVFSKNSWIAPLFKPVVPTLALTLFVVGLLAAWAAWKRNPRWIFAALASVPILLLTVNFQLLATILYPKNNTPIAVALAPRLSPDTEIMCLGCYPNGLSFYLKRIITVVSNDGAELTSNYIIYTLQNSKVWPENIIPWNKLESRLANTQHPIYLLAMPNHQAELEKIANQKGIPIELLSPGYWGLLLNSAKGN